MSEHKTKQEWDIERAQVAHVFRIEESVLENQPWSYAHATRKDDDRDPEHIAVVTAIVRRHPGLETWRHDAGTFCHWSKGAPEYLDNSKREREILDATHVRTVYADETFREDPDRFTDSAGRVWTLRGRFSSSGETECLAGEGELVTDTTSHTSETGRRECPYCEEELGERHGYVYIGDGWSELVYVGEEDPEEDE